MWKVFRATFKSSPYKQRKEDSSRWEEQGLRTYWFLHSQHRAQHLVPSRYQGCLIYKTRSSLPSQVWFVCYLNYKLTWKHGFWLSTGISISRPITECSEALSTSDKILGDVHQGGQVSHSSRWPQPLQLRANIIPPDGQLWLFRARPWGQQCPKPLHSILHESYAYLDFLVVSGTFSTLLQLLTIHLTSTLLETYRQSRRIPPGPWVNTLVACWRAEVSSWPLSCPQTLSGLMPASTGLCWVSRPPSASLPFEQRYLGSTSHVCCCRCEPGSTPVPCSHPQPCGDRHGKLSSPADEKEASQHGRVQRSSAWQGGKEKERKRVCVEGITTEGIINQAGFHPTGCFLTPQLWATFWAPGMYFPMEAS